MLINGIQTNKFYRSTSDSFLNSRIISKQTQWQHDNSYTQASCEKYSTEKILFKNRTVQHTHTHTHTHTLTQAIPLRNCQMVRSKRKINSNQPILDGNKQYFYELFSYNTEMKINTTTTQTVVTLSKS